MTFKTFITLVVVTRAGCLREWSWRELQLYLNYTKICKTSHQKEDLKGCMSCEERKTISSSINVSGHTYLPVPGIPSSLMDRCSSKGWIGG